MQGSSINFYQGPNSADNTEPRATNHNVMTSMFALLFLLLLFS